MSVAAMVLAAAAAPATFGVAFDLGVSIAEISAACVAYMAAAALLTVWVLRRRNPMTG